MNIRTALALATLGLLLTSHVAASTAEDVASRTAPVGSVNAETGQDAKAQTVSDKDETSKTQTTAASKGESTVLAQGKKIVEAHCNVCHSQGIAGAPKFGDEAAWAPRIKQGMQTLFKHVKEGLNAMPAKGMCMQCTDEDLRAAVHYMVSTAQPKS